MAIYHGEYTKKFEDLMDPKRYPSMAKTWNPMMLCKRDRYLTPEELKVNVLNSTRINKILDERSNSDEKLREKLREEVREMLDEIGLASSVTVIRILGQISSSVISRIYDKIYVNEAKLKKIKSDCGANPVLFLPSHRSYGDFILMSIVCFAYDIEIPAIAAGMDFHGMIGMGAALRKTGAFFMRRKFTKDTLYWHVFKEYVHSLATIFHRAIEFFVEGTRSRSYKALPPKIGLLSMTLEPLFMGEISDVTIVPISISYEKPLEEQLFVYELLGVPKPKESTLGLFKALSIVEQNFGSLIFDFGEPISAKDFFGDNLNRQAHSIEPANVQILSKNELNHINDLAFEIVRSQQNMHVISSFNFVSYYFIYRNYLEKTTNVDEMVQGVAELSDIFTQLGAGVLTNENNIKAAILYTLKIHKNVIDIAENGLFEIVQQKINLKKSDLRKLKGHNLSEIVMQISVPAFTFQLYVNPCLHWVAQPGIMILSCKSLISRGIIEFNEFEINEEVLWLRTLFSQEFVFHNIHEKDDFRRGMQFLISSNILQNTANGEYTLNIDHKWVNLILSGIAPFLCCYLQASKTILNEFSGKTFSEPEYLSKVQENVEKLILVSEDFCHPYCLSLDSISMSLIAFHNNQYLDKNIIDSKCNYTPSIERLNSCCIKLEQYCQLFPFKYVKLCHNLFINSKL